MPYSRHYLLSTLLGASAILALTATPDWQGSASAATNGHPLDIRPPAARAVDIKATATRVHAHRAAPKRSRKELVAPVETVEDIDNYPTEDCWEANVPGPEKEFDGNLLWKCTYQWIMRYSYDLRDQKNLADWSAIWRAPPLGKEAMRSRELAVPAVHAMVASLEFYDTDRFNHLDEPARTEARANFDAWAQTWSALPLDHDQMRMPGLALPALGPLIKGTPIDEANRFKPFSVTEPVKEEIPQGPVKSKLVDTDVNYVRLDNFVDDGSEQFKSALERGVAAKASLYVIDLRKNRGGYIHLAEHYTELLLDQAIFGSETFRDGSSTSTETKVLTHDGWLVGTAGYPFAFYPRTAATVVPATASIVIILDGESASASEMVAGACRANGRCIVVGSASFGKDRRQRPFNLPYGYSVTLVDGEFHPGEMNTGWSGVLADHLVRGQPEEMGNPERDPAMAEALRVGRIDAANRASIEYQRVYLEQHRRGDYLLWRSKR